MRPRLAYLRKAPKRERTLLVMIVFVFVMNMPAMIVPVMVEMSVPVFMRVFMPLGMMMQPLAGPWPTRVLAEYERLDGDRHGVRRHADAAEIDIVEVHQHDAVDDQDLSCDVKLFAQDRAQSLRHVAIQHDVNRLAPGDAVSEAAANAFGQPGKALVGRHALPAQRQCDVSVGIAI